MALLDELFDKLDWSVELCEAAEEEIEGIHGPGCTCADDDALKIQYLRLVRERKHGRRSFRFSCTGSAAVS